MELTNARAATRGPTKTSDSFDVGKYFVTLDFIEGMDPHRYWLWLIPVGGAGGVGWRLDSAEDLRITTQYLDTAFGAKQPVRYDGASSQLWVFGQ